MRKFLSTHVPACRPRFLLAIAASADLAATHPVANRHKNGEIGNISAADRDSAIVRSDYSEGGG